MARKPKKQQGDQEQNEDQFVDIPEDRLSQIEGSESRGEEAEETQSEESTQVSGERAEAQSEAPEKKPEQQKGSREDLLEGIRHSLAEEEEQVEEPKGFFGRIRERFKRSSSSEVEESEPLVPLEIDLEPLEKKQEPEPQPEPPSEPKEGKSKPSRMEEEEKAIQDFFSDLEAMADVSFEEESQETPAEREIEIQEEEPEQEQPEPEEVPVHVAKLPARSAKEEEVDFDAVREMALQEYDETKIEPEERKQPVQEEVKRTLRDLRPFERVMLIIVGVITVGVLLSSGVYLIVDSITVPTPTPTAVVDIRDTVHPTGLSLPGGWHFDLGLGQVNEGKWVPSGAQWLVGTEISRWVALPWSLQLEAVLRTLKSGDELELTMSNFDVVTFEVYSIQQITMEQLLASNPTKPSLLVVLYNDEEADGTFWVVTALP